MPNHAPDHYPPIEKMLSAVAGFGTHFGDLSKVEKLSDIKQPLVSDENVSGLLSLLDE